MEQGKPVRRDHTSGRGNVTYPPLDVIKPVAGDVWVVDSGPLHAFGLSMPVRMTVLRLRNGDLLLHSPTRYTSELHRSLQQLGAIRHLIAPNIAHWSFADAWQRACPGSLLWAAPKLKERGQVKRAGFG